MPPAQGYDDFKSVNVEGKFILRLSGLPGHNDTASAAYKKFGPVGRFSRWRLDREKNKAARERGAVGVLELSPGDHIELSWAENSPARYNTPYYEGTERLHVGKYNYMTIPADTLDTKLTVVEITRRLATELLKGSNIEPEKFEKDVANSLRPQSKELDGRKIYVKTAVNSRIVKVKNVLGKIEGSSPDEIVAIGGQFAHAT